MERFFQLKKRGTTIKTEIFAGITTFMAMAYILMVNAGMFAELGVVSYNAIYISTAISAVIGTLLMGLLADLPLAQAPGMGLNAFFVYTVCLGFGLSYANSLVLVLIEGIIFVILTLTGIRAKIFDAIPEPVCMAIPAGIGLFIAFLGLQSAGIVVSDTSTGVSLASFNVIGGTAAWNTVMPMLVTIFTLIFIAVLTIKKIKGSVLWGILGGTAVYYIFGFTSKGFYNDFLGSNFSFNPFTAFKEFGVEAFGKVFTKGFDFSGYLETHSVSSLIILLVTTSLAFCLVDMFNTLGTLYGACSRGNILTKEGEIPSFENAMLSDAIATCCGSVCGTSTITTFVESSAGVAEGGRTGLTAIVTACMFFFAMFLSPLASLIPGCAISAALIYVGALMMNCVTNIDWNDLASSLPAFMTVAMMPFTYNISYGISFGLISYVLVKLFIGKAKEVKTETLVIAVLFGIMFFVTH